jgi:hypothetical protein
VHANRIVSKRDRDGLERLCRYGLRPAVALERLVIATSGKVSYPRKYPTRWGETMLTLEPVELLKRLATLIPPARTHLVRYAGAFAPHSKLRAAIVRALVASAQPPATPGEATQPDASAVGRAIPPVIRERRLKWAELLKRVFAFDVLVCRDCGNRMRVIAFLSDANVTRTILEHLHLPFEAPATRPARAPPEIPLSAGEEPGLDAGDAEPPADEPPDDSCFPDPEPDYDLV